MYTVSHSRPGSESLFEWMNVEDHLVEDVKVIQVVFLIEMLYQIISNTVV